MAVKPLNSNVEFLVDLGIWEQLPWSGWRIGGSGYISCCGVMLHHVVPYLRGLDLRWDQVVDHKNRNRLDNRGCNLRICSPIENGWNVEKKHGHKLKNGKWKFTFSKSYPTYQDAEREIQQGNFQYMNKNRTCFMTETFDSYEEGYQWWRFQAGIHYGEFSPFAHPYRTCEEIIKEACENSKNQQPS